MFNGGDVNEPQELYGARLNQIVFDIVLII
jgi:hypothetical protein